MNNFFEIMPAAIALLIALSSNFLLLRISDRVIGNPLKIDDTKFSTIDGLRGFLAFAVFLHHSAFWWEFNQAGVWRKPANIFYVLIGEVGVSLFFMITAFLFVGKIIDSKSKPINWNTLFVGRILRLTPLYAVVMIVLFIIVGVQTNWVLNSSPWNLFKELLTWITFTFAGRVDINGLPETRLITSGVTWTLSYEWFFYLLLPVVALLAGRRPPTWAIAVSVLVPFLLLIVWRPGLSAIAPFLSGSGAAVLVRLPVFQKIANHPAANLAIIGAITSLFLIYETAFSSLGPLILLSIAFVLIAGGGSLFGLLTSRSCRFFGGPAYSMYLWHGMLLYGTFAFWIGAEAHALSIGRHWVIICCITPVLVTCSHLSYRLIELPFTRLLKLHPRVA